MSSRRGAGEKPTWLSRALPDAIHTELIGQYGGTHGVHDEAFIESALARPQNLLAYVPDSDIFALAVPLCYGLAKNCGFRDGNKRTAFAAPAFFLGLNELWLTVPEAKAAVAMLYVAIDEWDDEKLAARMLIAFTSTAVIGMMAIRFVHVDPYVVDVLVASATVIAWTSSPRRRKSSGTSGERFYP